MAKPYTGMGQVFTTKAGKRGCYKYVRGRRVAFIELPKKRKYRIANKRKGGTIRGKRTNTYYMQRRR
tara:strand:- start:502 stop:702 length:201 start_codon:yes stop_codon:yes gene_type:complete